MSRPNYESYDSVPSISDSHTNRGYGGQEQTGVNDFAHSNPSASMSSPLQPNQSGSRGDLDNNQLGSSVQGEDDTHGLNRSASSASTAVANQQQQNLPSRNNTLKKKGSVRRTTSLKRSSSRKSLRAGSIKGVQGAKGFDDFNSVFFTPVPTSGTPTEILANRFQSWRQLLKSLIAYFREIQSSYDQRAKAVHKVHNTITNITNPAVFMSDNGLGDATRILAEYHKRSIAEANKSREIENDVIGALTGLRSDLGQKIKEIKSLSGDFKNSVDKEKQTTAKEVEKLQEALQHADHEDGSATGKNDPYVVKLGVDRMVEKQIDEENYLHRAYLNLESSGRELESIVVGEIQKAYNALAGILKREGDDAYNTVESLRTGPIAMPKDQEWTSFVENDPHFVDPRTPLRRIEDIEYPGKEHPAVAEVRAGMLERKSKYLKSYTPGWYVLSPTHLHEFKSADKIYSQPPVMSLYLPDQKLGSHSQEGSSSNKFMLKGRQAGGMHKGHSWVFRAETHDTMMAWFDDMKVLTESSGPARDAFVRKHARSVSGDSQRARSVSSDGLEDDEADQNPYSADATSLAEQYPAEPRIQRPQPGGRFPSDLNVNAARNAPTSPSSEGDDQAFLVGAAGLPESHTADATQDVEDPYRLQGVRSGTATDGTATQLSQTPGDSYIGSSQAPPETYQPTGSQFSQGQDQSFLAAQPVDPQQVSLARHNSGNEHRDWLAPAAGAGAGAGLGAAGIVAHGYHNQDNKDPYNLPESTGNATNRTVGPSSSKNEGLGGLEKEGAHATGTFFPTVVRHDTDMSVSQLHVPGEFPKRS